MNGLPVSWFATRDWANVGRSQTEIEEAEAAWAQSLKPGSEIAVRPGKPVKKGDANSAVPQQVTVKEASIERDLVSTVGASYVRVTVTDHARPLDDAVDRFIVAVRALPENAWAHFHCEAGLGRTTTFMVLYDMLRNATRVSLEDIVRRQKLFHSTTMYCVRLVLGTGRALTWRIGLHLFAYFTNMLGLIQMVGRSSGVNG